MKRFGKIFAILMTGVMLCGTSAALAQPNESAAQGREDAAAAANDAKQPAESAADTISVVCVGDSITAAGYPEALGTLLGEEYTVTNCGQPGTQMMSGARFSYMDQDVYQESLDLAADYYILMLGSNDSMTTAQWDPDLFRKDYTSFLESYVKLADSKIYVMIPPCVYKDENPRMLSSRVDLDILYEEICPMISEIAQNHEVSVIDLHTLTDGHPEWLADGLHPNEEGNQNIAEYIYKTVFEETEGK